MTGPGDDGWMLPTLGKLADVRLALAAVRRVVDPPPPRDPSTPIPRVGPPAPFSELELSLLEMMQIQARLSALLLGLIERQSEADGGPVVTPSAVLDLIQTQHQARADLDSLDDGAPFHA